MKNTDIKSRTDGVFLDIFHSFAEFVTITDKTHLNKTKREQHCFKRQLIDDSVTKTLSY